MLNRLYVRSSFAHCKKQGRKRKAFKFSGTGRFKSADFFKGKPGTPSRLEGKIAGIFKKIYKYKLTGQKYAAAV
jgi:hypothetical protein